ncbi:MAG: ATP-binding protein [Aphanizomenon flos-aquae DEX188]|jgi:predicted ATPase|nr:MAG: ATP-binding protein [Aphanizomenon flos-aquae DEX188]
MWISEVTLNNFRSFENANIQLSKGINLIVGANNSGKSTLLKSILWIQNGFECNGKDLRVFENDGYAQLWLNELNDIDQKWVNDFYSLSVEELFKGLSFKLFILKHSIEYHLIKSKNSSEFTPLFSFNQFKISNKEPVNFIYPYLSKRKVVNFNESINLDSANLVTGDLYHLYAKIDRIHNPQIPAYKQYLQACEDIIGFSVGSIPASKGKQAAYSVSNWDHITLDAMGEGVANLVGLIVDLCMAENKLFLIEEPENDIHPKALKKLLNLIAEKSANNQFIITTHSNIVAKYLGALPDSKLFSVSMDFENRIPTSHIEEIPNTPEAKRNVLEELGYDLFDFDLWSAWLILEESSAESIIKEFLIPWFAPDLQSKIRTFSARTLDEVESKFEDFNNLFVFLHLQPAYKNLAWVIVDSGEKEAGIIERLKNTYTRSGWNANNFLQFSEHDFERYYPIKFKEEIDNVLKQPSGKHKQKDKTSILEQVKTWCKENPEEAKVAFQESASEIIEILEKIELSVCNSSND